MTCAHCHQNITNRDYGFLFSQPVHFKCQSAFKVGYLKQRDVRKELVSFVERVRI